MTGKYTINDDKSKMNRSGYKTADSSGGESAIDEMSQGESQSHQFSTTSPSKIQKATARSVQHQRDFSE